MASAFDAPGAEQQQGGAQHFEDGEEVVAGQGLQHGKAAQGKAGGEQDGAHQLALARLAQPFAVPCAYIPVIVIVAVAHFIAQRRRPQRYAAPRRAPSGNYRRPCLFYTA